MKNYHKNLESTYLKFQNVNNLYGCAISKKLPLGGFMQVKNRSQFYESFLKNYNEDSNKRHFLKFNVKYSEKIHEILNGLPFLTERMKSGGAEELLSNFYDEKENVVHIRTFKEVLIYGLLLIKVHRVNKINQKA